MTASNVIPVNFRQSPIRCIDAEPSIRSDCERLMRRLVKDGRTPSQDLHVLADVLDAIIVKLERNGSLPVKE